MPPADALALARGLTQLLDDSPLAARLSAAGDERAAEFSMDTLANAYVEIYERITA